MLIKRFGVLVSGPRISNGLGLVVTVNNYSLGFGSCF